MRNSKYGAWTCLVLVFITPLAVQAGVITPHLQSALEHLGPNEEVSFILTLSDQLDLGQFREPDLAIRRARMIRSLRDKADLTQRPLMALLIREGAARMIRLWLINGIAVRARTDAIYKLARHPAIKEIQLDYPIVLPATPSGSSTEAEGNIGDIRAPEVWALGYNGQGIVVATMDSGVDLNHPDLTSRYRGGANSWYDPYGQHDSPSDIHGHGTQVMGIIVGGDASGTGIGVAPGAQWIAVKAFNDSGEAYLSAIHQGFQWLLDPDENPDTDDAPDIVNNSWTLQNTVDRCDTEFASDIATLKAAGIAVVFSAGNGPGTPASSVSPSNNIEAFAVGAVDGAHNVAPFSNRGPSACDGGIYPEIVAPGVNVKTSDLTLGGISADPYMLVSGTSFSAPHVSGAMALLLSAFPEISVTALESALTQSAVDFGDPGPDNAYGHGMVDVMEAYRWLTEYQARCTDSDGDGYHAGPDCGSEVDCNDGDPSIHPDAPEIKGDGIDQDCDGRDLTVDRMKGVYLLLLSQGVVGDHPGAVHVSATRWIVGSS